MQEIYKTIIMYADYPLLSKCAQAFTLVAMSISLEMLYHKICNITEHFIKA